MDPVSRIEKIIIHPDVVHLDLTRRILKNGEGISCEIADSVPDMALSSGKKILYLSASQGTLVKSCPATPPPYLCCQYTVIHSCTQCPMDCTYCILQNYLDSPFNHVNVRLDDIFQEMTYLQNQYAGRFLRFGTGELGDSLALDPITGLSEDFISFVSQKRNVLIELKTKSVCIDRVIRMPAKNTVISWSLNPESVIRTQEMYAASLQDRLVAARQCQEAGYLLGFHFDPILYFTEAGSAYQKTVDHIFSSVDADRIAWISLGTLRFPPALKAVIQNRFPGSPIIYEEMIPGLDGKMRYPKPMRIDLYSSIVERIRTYSEDLFIYFCMESPRIWDQVLGSHPSDNGDLDFWFARSLWERFGSELDMDKPERGNYPVIDKK